MTTIGDVLDKADSYADGPHFHGYFGTRREVLRAAIEQYAAERVAEATAETRLRKLLNTPELHDAAQTQALQDVLAERRRQSNRMDDLVQRLRELAAGALGRYDEDQKTPNVQG